jgi:cobalt-zinc-cadmium efflux system membrane fusion protein
MNMRTSQTLIIAVVLVLIASGAIYLLSRTPPEPIQASAPENVLIPAEAPKSKAQGAEDEKADHGETTAITPKAAEAAGIQSAEAAPAIIHEVIRLTGRVTLNQNATAQVKARFPGIVRSVTKSPGDSVKKDEVLATVESNESLQVYPVKSPLDGVVLTRATNVGDVAADTPMFTITNASEVWAEFHVFPRDMDQVETGQKVLVTSFEGEHRGEAVITTLLPVAESSTQTVVARVTLPNPDKVWRAGMTVRGDVVISERNVAVAVKNAAIQRLEGKTVVFVLNGVGFEARAVRTGASDSEFTEVLEGLSPGERYASENSFQIKANIGKAGAAHED